MGLLLAAMIAVCLAVASTLDLRTEKSLAGVLVACVTIPTVLVFLVYGRGKR